MNSYNISYNDIRGGGKGLFIGGGIIFAIIIVFVILYFMNVAGLKDKISGSTTSSSTTSSSTTNVDNTDNSVTLNTSA